MALTPADIEQFISALHDDASLRERVRSAILADDFLALPGITARLAERMDTFAERMDQLTARLDQLAARMDQLTDALTRLTARVDNMDGRLGDVEGSVYEFKYDRNLGAHLARRYRKVSRVIPADVDAVANAYDTGVITEDEWDDLHRVDVVASAVRRGDPAGTLSFIVLELSLTVDERDVARSSRRAGIMRKAGVTVEAAVDGEQVTAGAVTLARELGVTVLVSKEADAA
ncbi:MAG: hypothetical protein ACRDG3_01955 [Tepidiformaceae bacterium]